MDTEPAVRRTRAASDAAPVDAQRLLDIIDTLREPLLVLDARFRVSQANLAFFRTFRLEPADTIGHDLFTLADGHWDIAPMRALLCEQLAVAARHDDLEFDHVFPGIGRKIMRLNARRAAPRATDPAAIVLAFEDVTERRFTEWRLAEQRRELERSNAALDEFASVASHDLQEPLRKILSFGERLSTALGPHLEGDARHSLDRMVSAARRMRQLVQDVLAYSQVTAHVHPFVPTDLAWVAREVLIDLESAVQAAAARIEVGPLPVIEADTLQMRLLFQNLLSNALKYRRHGTTSVVQVTSLAGHNGHCTITVTDNGIGFHPDYADRIFQMFARLHGRAEYDGSGIGLAICRRIVDRHGGTIVAAGSPGQGAVFTVTLPVTHAMGLGT